MEEQNDEAPEEDILTNNERKPVRPETIENKLEEPITALRSDIVPENVSNSQHEQLNNSAVNPATPKGPNKTKTKKKPNCQQWFI